MLSARDEREGPSLNIIYFPFKNQNYQITKRVIPKETKPPRYDLIKKSPLKCILSALGGAISSKSLMKFLTAFIIKLNYT